MNDVLSPALSELLNCLRSLHAQHLSAGQDLFTAAGGAMHLLDLLHVGALNRSACLIRGMSLAIVLLSFLLSTSRFFMRYGRSMQGQSIDCVLVAGMPSRHPAVIFSAACSSWPAWF